MEKQKKNKINKEIKRNRSAKFPPDSTILNNSLFKDNSDNGSNNTNSTTCEGLLKIKSNSLFAYQEIDKYSSFCDNESNREILSTGQNEKKSNINNSINDKDELNNTSFSYSLNEFLEDIKMNNNAKKRNSAFGSMPPYFAQYLGQNFQIGDENYYFDKNDNNFFNNIMNSQFPFEIRRTNTEKQNKNFVNAFFNQFSNISNNKEKNFFDNKGQNKGFIPLYNYNGYNQNFGNLNNFNNLFYLNNAFNPGGERQNDCIQGIPGIQPIQSEKKNCPNDNINMPNMPNIPNKSNINEKRDFPNVLNEIPEKVRQKSNSIVVKQSPFNQINQFKLNYPYLSTISKFPLNPNTNSKDKKHLNNYNNNNSVLHYFQDQANCRNIQEQLELHKKDFNYIKDFLEEIKPDLINIIEHQFGNYVIQKLLEIIIYQENKLLMKEFILVINKNNKLYEISVNNYGTRVIQKTLEKLIDNNIPYSKIECPELTNSINELIRKHLYDLCCDKNGNHVYQKLLKVFHNDNKNDFLYDYLARISLDIALLQQGATIFTTAFNFSNYQQKEKISKNIIDNIDKLINDKYGNYSLQAIIKQLENEKALIEPIYFYISDNIVVLSKQKYSSNVIDTFIMKKDNYSKMLVKDMIKKNIIKDIIKDQYANYVVQKAMNISDEETVHEIIKEIKPIVPELLESNIGKKIYEKLSQQYNDFFNQE
jgi:pumilio RNA-binding family